MRKYAICLKSHICVTHLIKMLKCLCAITMRIFLLVLTFFSLVSSSHLVFSFSILCLCLVLIFIVFVFWFWFSSRLWALLYSCILFGGFLLTVRPTLIVFHLWLAAPSCGSLSPLLCFMKNSFMYINLVSCKNIMYLQQVCLLLLFQVSLG